MLPVTIQNDFLRLEVWPQIGGKVSSIIDVADGFNLLSSYPAELPMSAQYDIAFAKGWYAGWDECFPAIAASKYVGHPYDGIAVPDHGELWGIPTTSATPTHHGITTVWHGLRFGYQLTRNLHIDGPTMTADYTLVNFAPFDFRFVWSMHPLMSLQSPVELEMGSGAAFRWDHDIERSEIGLAFEWPLLAEVGDLSRPSKLPPHRGWKVFSVEAISGPANLKYPERQRRLTIDYRGESSPAAYWGIWINTGGRYRHQHFSIEPTTGRHDELDRAIRDGSAGRVEASGRTSWSVTWTVDGL